MYELMVCIADEGEGPGPDKWMRKILQSRHNILFLGGEGMVRWLPDTFFGGG